MAEATLEDTPTWIVASVCSVIVLISFVFERALHRLGKVRDYWSLRPGTPRHALEQIHIFIFVLAITHVVLSAVTVLLGLLQMRKWMHWENSVREGSAPKMITRVQKMKFIQNQCKGHERIAMVRILMRSFFKQFYGSVTMNDYVAMRLGFVTEHFSWHPKFNFYNYMIRALEKDFKRVVGIKWYYWIFVMVFLLLNIAGWHSYFWISLVPLALLLLIGTKLEHIINKLAYEVATRTKHDAAAVESGASGHPVMSPSDELFWFRRPRLVLVVIHFILFQNAFEFAFFIWTLATFGVKSCMMDGLGYGVSRIAICVFVQVLCSYSTLPLYAIVTHMGSSFKSAVFADDVAENLRGWADAARERNRMAAAAAAGGDVGCLGGAAAGAAAKSDAGGASVQLRSLSLP